ncbi:MAG TPA: CHAT domain-containing protein [Candidatus Angelobacter sp.]|nr:CHAT domain-containing protein [Candidatus Angelobacter sp.]
MDHETRHISFEELAALASGKLSGRRSEEIEGHLAGCASCRQQLQEYEQFTADAQTPASGDLTDEWKELKRRMQPKKVITMRRWLPPIAAAVILVAGLSWIVVDRIRNRPQHFLVQAYREQQLLLAQAYHERRSFDLRLPGAASAPVRLPMGGGSELDRLRPLVKAKDQLLDEMSKNPSDPDLLRLWAESQMMERKANDAVQTLEHALILRADDPEILADLGAAYALRGDIETRFSDYSTAAEYLGQSLSLRTPVPQVVFNLALVQERMKLYDQAIKSWKEYLNLGEADDGWRKEAKDHLDDLQKELKVHETAPGEVQGDAKKFLALPPASRSLNAESYLDYAQQWLLEFNTDQNKREALTTLAEDLKQHKDFWLAHIAASGMGPNMIAGFKKLEDADQQKNNAAKLADIHEAAQIFLRADNNAGVLQTRYRELVLLHNASRLPECRVAAAALRHDLESHPYARMRARVEIEDAICAMWAGDLGAAELPLRRAIKISSEAGMNNTTVEARSRYLSSLRHSGSRSNLFDAAKDLLNTFWEGSYEPYLFYQVADELRDIAAEDGQKYAALFLARSAVWAAKAQSHILYEAPAEFNLAVAAQAVGADNEAQEHLKKSDLLFDKIPAEYQVGPGADLATIELKQDHIDSALQRLEKLHDKVMRAASADAENYYSTLGEAYRKEGQMAEAETAFRESIARGKQRLASKDDERTGVLKSMARSYQGLVAVTLALPGGKLDALHTWQQYQALDAGISPESIRRLDVPVLSYVHLPDGFAAWLVQGDQVTFHPLAPQPHTAKIVKRFLGMCSDSQSDYQSLRRDAQQLYEWMIGPFAEQLRQTAGSQGLPQPLIVELDGDLAGIPVQALMSPDERYLGDQFFIMNSVGVRASELRQEVFNQRTSVLVVADPVVRGLSAGQFPSLSNSLKEAAEVQNAFPLAVSLLKEQATIAAFQGQLHNAEIVHFSGHGYANGENGALLFATKDSALDYDPLRSSEVAHQDWSRVQLVVLSACAAAAGETRGPHNPDSLVRSLIRAGPSRVVAALWIVDSGATLKLMKEFYSSLGQGKTPAQALHTAQQKMRQSEWAHPYYWAGFQLYRTR